MLNHSSFTKNEIKFSFLKKNALCNLRNILHKTNEAIIKTTILCDLI